MRKTLFFVLLLAGGRLWASQGIVETTDGKAFEGEIRLECGGVVISDTNQPSVRVEFAHLKLVRFQIPVAEGIPTPTGRTTALDAANVSRLKLPAGIQLTSGSLMARRISVADDTAVRYFDSTNETVLSNVNVARILFQPMPCELEERVRSGRPGVLLSNHEFVEGQFKGFADGQIKLSSILFGNTSYDPGQVIAVILRETKPMPARFELKTRDESLFLADAIRFERDSILLQDPRFCGIR